MVFNWTGFQRHASIKDTLRTFQHDHHAHWTKTVRNPPPPPLPFATQVSRAAHHLLYIAFVKWSSGTPLPLPFMCAKPVDPAALPKCLHHQYSTLIACTNCRSTLCHTRRGDDAQKQFLLCLGSSFSHPKRIRLFPH